MYKTEDKEESTNRCLKFLKGWDKIKRNITQILAQRRSWRKLQQFLTLRADFTPWHAQVKKLCVTDLNCRESKQEASVHWIMVVVTGVSVANRSVNGGMVLAKVSCFEEPSSSLGAMDAGYPQVSHLDDSDTYAIILRCVVPRSSKRCLNHPKSTGELGNVDRASQRLVTLVS